MKSSVQATLFDILKGSVASVALFIAYTAIPVFGMLPGFFAPFPALFYSLKSGRGAGGAIASITALALMLLLGPGAAILYILQGGCIGLSLAEFLRRGTGVGRSIAFAVLLNLALATLLSVGYAAMQGVDIHGYILKGINASITETVSLYEKAGFKGDDLKGIRDAMAEAGSLIGKIYPALVVILTVAIAGLNMLLLKRSAAGVPIELNHAPFSSFRNPDQLVWVLIAAGFAMLIPVPQASTVALNILLVILCLYCAQGMAVITSFFERYGVSRFFRYTLYALLLIQPYMAIAVTVIGLFDLWGNFRAPKQQNL